MRPHLDDKDVASDGSGEPGVVRMRVRRGGGCGGAEPVKVAHAVRAGAQDELAGGALGVGGVVDVDGGVFEGGEGGEGEEVGVGGAPAVWRGRECVGE
jgi:hypothetical protein